MKIYMLARGLPPDVLGGMEVHTQELIKGLNKRGHSVTLANLITSRHPEGTVAEAGENFRAFYLGDKPYVTAKFHRDSADLFRRLNAEENFDIVHSQEVGYGYGFARFSSQKTPFVVTMHGVPITEIRDLFKRRTISSAILACRKVLRYKRINIDALYRMVLGRSDKVIAVGSRLLKDITDQYDLPQDKLVCIPNGVDTERFKPQSAEDLRARWNLEDGPVILAPGRIDSFKGFDILIKAFPAIRNKWCDARLFIAGEGPFLSDLEKLSRRIGSEGIIFTGQIPYQEMPMYYNLADAVVFPTLRSESFGLVAAEAMACGKAVVASRIGEIPEFIVNNSDGILVEPGNTEDLKKKVLGILDDRDLAIKIGKRAREKILQEFSLDGMVERTINLYTEVIQNKEGG